MTSGTWKPVPQQPCACVVCDEEKRSQQFKGSVELLAQAFRDIVAELNPAFKALADALTGPEEKPPTTGPQRRYTGNPKHH
jgi:hypothetical protein